MSARWSVRWGAGLPLSGFCGVCGSQGHGPGRQMRIGCGAPLANGLVGSPFDQVADMRRLVPLVEVEHFALYLAVGDREPMMASQVLHPVRTVIALYPDFGGGHILHERPALRAVTPPYAPQLAHGQPERFRVFDCDPIF